MAKGLPLKRDLSSYALSFLSQLEKSGGRAELKSFEQEYGEGMVHFLDSNFYIKTHRNGNIRLTATGRNKLREYREALEV